MTMDFPTYIPKSGDEITTPDQHIVVGERMDPPLHRDRFHVTIDGEETEMHIDGLTDLLAGGQVVLSRGPEILS